MSRLSSGIANEAATLEERVVTLPAGSVTLDPAKHANRLLLLTGAAVGNAVTLPVATGSGDEYEFLVKAAQTSGSITVSASHGSASNVIVGTLRQHGSGNVYTVFSSTTNDIITLNGSTQGAAKAGDRIKIMDVAANTWWVVDSQLTTSGTQATPFSG